MTKRVALITGGMGGLGETISTKMADAGYRVVVTYSPSNKTSNQWLADMKAKGYDFNAYACDVADFEFGQGLHRQGACRGRAGRYSGQQCRHHQGHHLPQDGPGGLEGRDRHQSRQRVQHDQAGLRRHDGSRLGPHHQRLLGQRLQGRLRADQLCRGQVRHARLHQIAGARSRPERASPSTPSRPAISAPRW